MSGTAEMVKCPGCEVKLPADDYQKQREHMDVNHPDIIARRRAEAKRIMRYAHD